MTKHTIATLISRFFDPIVVLTAANVYGLFLSSAPGVSKWRIIASFISVYLFPLVALFLAYIKVKRISWDLSDRRIRMKLLAIFIPYILIAWYLLPWKAIPDLQRLFLINTIWFIGVSVITLWYKISGHVGSVTLAVTLLITWLGWGWWPLYSIVPLMAWSRVVRKDHTIGEVIAGAVYTCTIAWVLAAVL